MSKRASITIVVILVIVLIALGVVWKIKKQNTKIDPFKTFSVEKKDLSSSELPKGLPRDLPIEAGSSVVQNFESTTNDGRIQSTRISTTQKPLGQAVKIYQDFFLAQGWTEIKIPNTDPESVSALFRRGDDVLRIGGQTDFISKKNTIEITLTENGK